MRITFTFFMSFWFLLCGNIEIVQATNQSHLKGRDKKIKILTIGNSFADNATTYLPRIVESVPGYSIEITKANIGGCSLEKHADLIVACEKDQGLNPYSEKYCLKELLEMDTFNYISIQQVSSLSWLSESFQPHADILIVFIGEHSPHSTIVIHQTWAYHPDCIRLKNWNISNSKMHDKLVENYNKLADEYNLNIIPSGTAFYEVYERYPGLNLWKEDNYHANINGCYLAGCVWFSRLFNVSPKNIKFVPEEMDIKTAKLLRKIAKKTIKAGGVSAFN